MNLVDNSPVHMNLASSEPLVCFPMKVDLPEGFLSPSDKSFPEPAATSRNSVHIPTPAPVLTLLAYAERLSWESRLTYANGWMPHATTGKPLGPYETWALRLKRGDCRAVAIRKGDAWNAFWTWSPRRLVARTGGFEAFKGELGADW